MIDVTHGGKKYGIWFRYKKLPPADLQAVCRTKSERRVVEAVIAEKAADPTQKPDALSKGIAVCHLNDNFRRTIGRKLALTQALSKFDRDFRQAMWAAYVDKCRL